MWVFSDFLLWSVMITVQLAGLASVVIARVCECSPKGVRYQRFFLICFLLVGMFSALMITCESNCRLVCAVTLPLMAVGATIDLRGSSASSSVAF